MKDALVPSVCLRARVRVLAVRACGHACVRVCVIRARACAHVHVLNEAKINIARLEGRIEKLQPAAKAITPKPIQKNEQEHVTSGHV